MGSCMLKNRFMIHVLNNLISYYNLQLALMEKRIGDNQKPLTVEEIRAELSLHFERLSMKSMRKDNGEELEEQSLFAVNLKVNVEIVDRLGTSHSSAKIVQITMTVIIVTQLPEILHLLP
jgi:hypothetical protein